ncbi:hypothetical protein ANCCAN_06871 [Ancylostoma caninum]|uniref:Uncharacterized protein n=1 Tax=Ancylostoma caninum TaxID=29170 RepID=A0A368GVK2_ANCCA|nr:hypothetical protein ANCCAN_06871 [Ancylostoma caninum]
MSRPIRGRLTRLTWMYLSGLAGIPNIGIFGISSMRFCYPVFHG